MLTSPWAADAQVSFRKYLSDAFPQLILRVISVRHCCFKLPGGFPATVGWQIRDIRTRYAWWLGRLPAWLGRAWRGRGLVLLGKPGFGVRGKKMCCQALRVFIDV